MKQKLILTGLIASVALICAVIPSQAAPKFTPEQAKSLSECSYAAAIDTATWGSPAVIMYSLRYNDAVGPKVKAAPNSLWRIQDVATPALAEKEGYVPFARNPAVPKDGMLRRTILRTQLLRVAEIHDQLHRAVGQNHVAPARR